MAEHKAGFVFVIVGTVLLYLGTLALQISAILIRFGVDNAILPTDPLSIRDSYPFAYEPAEWFEAIQIPIAVWQLLWLGYGLSTICRTNNGTGSYLYYSPAYIPITLYLIYGTGMISLIAWLFAWSYEYISWALAFQAMLSFSMFMAMVFASRALWNNCEALVIGGQFSEVQAVHGLILNGVAFYSGYVDFSVTINLGRVLVHHTDLDEDIAGIVLFAILLVSYVLFFLLEITVWDKYARYMMMHYVAGVVGLTAVMTSIFDGDVFTSTTHYVVLVALIVTALMLLGKMINACVRDRRVRDRVRAARKS